MALSSIAGSSYGSNVSNRNTFVPSKTTNTVPTNVNGVRGPGNDTYFCASCGGRKIVSSFYCPTCSGGSSARTSTPFSNTHGNCPTCGKTDATRSAAARQGAFYYHNPNSGVR